MGKKKNKANEISMDYQDELFAKNEMANNFIDIATLAQRDEYICRQTLRLAHAIAQKNLLRNYENTLASLLAEVQYLVKEVD